LHLTGADTTAGGGEEVAVGVDTCCALVLDGPVGVAPLRSPCEAGSRKVLAEIDAVIWGNPDGAAPRLMALSVISRPLTDSLWFPITTNRCRRPRKSARWKKFPWNVNVN